MTQDKGNLLTITFYETQVDNELDRQKFDPLTQPEELHYCCTFP